MTFKRRSSGAWTDIANLKRRASGAWTNVANLYRRSSGLWVRIWPNLVQITDWSILVTGTLSGSAQAAYRLNASGIVEKGDKAVFSTLETWLLSGAAADYEVMVTRTGGSGTLTGTTGSWLALSTTRTWSVNRPVSSVGIDNATLSVSIRQVSTGTVLDTATIYLESER